MSSVKLKAEAGASLNWLPQESILFDGASLSRAITADLAADARFLAVESVVLGREASGETVAHASLRDRWRIRQAGKLIFADDLAFDGRAAVEPSNTGQRPGPLPPCCWSTRKPNSSSTRSAPQSEHPAAPVPGLASWLQGSAQEMASDCANP